MYYDKKELNLDIKSTHYSIVVITGVYLLKSMSMISDIFNLTAFLRIVYIINYMYNHCYNSFPVRWSINLIQLNVL